MNMVVLWQYGRNRTAEKLQIMKPDDTVEVGIWLSPIVFPPFPEREISRQEYKEILDAKRKAYAEKEKPRFSLQFILN